MRIRCNLTSMFRCANKSKTGVKLCESELRVSPTNISGDDDDEREDDGMIFLCYE